MQAPKCKICDVAHWGNEPHQFSKSAPVAPKKAAAQPSKASAKRGRPKMDGPSEGKSERAEYQRELMRKKRATTKGAK